MAKQNSELEVVIKGKDELSPALQQFESRIIRTVGFISAALAGIRIGAAPITAAAEFEREMANVAKTTDFASKAIAGGIGELDRLASALLNISLAVDVTAADLAKIAAAAGQQGLGRFGVEGVAAFTDSVARMASVLDVTADQAANDVGKIVNIFKLPLADIERAVSTFNEVSNKSTASGEELLDVVKRIGDAAGALNLGDSVAIAATALDFGTSPEVAGTAFARVFSVMTEKADEFAELMKGVTKNFSDGMEISATNWIKRLKADGVGAFREFLATLRKLDEQSQQAAIVKLVGGGRIGALLNKFVQDTTDSVLQRNLVAARDGEQGVSALREQAVVLGTLDAQAKILRNSFVKLGIDSAQSLLGPLTQYTAQLSAALQQPGVQSFVAEAVRSIGQLVGFLAAGIKEVASWNVNWENFIKVAQVFIGLKLATALGDVISRISLFGVSLKSIAKDGQAAASATNAAGQAAQNAGQQIRSSFLARLLGIQELTKGVQAQTAATKELAAAETELAAKRKIADPLIAKANVANAAAKGQDTAVASAGGQVAQQREALRRAEAAAAQAQVAQQAALATRIAQAEAASQARRLQIEQDYQTRRRAIVATGTETGLKALRAERVRLLAEEEASQQRSIRGIQAYYARRAATQQAALQVEIQNERAALMQRLGTFDGLVNEQTARRLAANAATAAAASASAGVTAVAARVGLLTAAARTATAAISSLGFVLRTLGSIAVAAGRIISGAFFWVTILYSIADATGLLQKLGPAFQKVTDAIGLTSEAQRKKNIEDARALKATAELTAKIEEQTQAYRDNIDARTGAQNIQNTQSLVQQAAVSTDPAKQQEALGKVGQQLFGAQVTVQDAPEFKRRVQAAVDEQVRIIEQAQKDIAQKQIDAERVMRAGAARGAPVSPARRERILQEYAPDIQELQKRIEAARQVIGRLQGSLSASGKDAETAKKGFSDLSSVIGSMFTPESAKGLEQFVLPIAQAREEVAKLQEAFKKQQQAAVEGGAGSAAALTDQEAQLKSANKKVTDALANLRAYIAEQTKVKGVSQNVIDSYNSLFTFGNLSSDQLKAYVEALKLVSTTDLTGKNVPKPAPAASGDGKFTSSKEESQARKLARARLQLERARIQAENALADEQSKQTLDREQRLYDQGLRAINEYYDAREKIQQDALNRDIADKQREIQAVNFELQGAKDEVERKRFETDKVRLQGQIKVLQEQRKGITAENDEQRRKASQDFNDRVASETNRLQVDQIIPADAQTIFQGSLDGLLAQWRVFLAQLQKENPDLAAALIKSFNVEAFKKSIQPAMDAIDGAFSELQRLQTRINLARQENGLTSVQAELLYSETVRKQVPILEDKLRVMQSSLELMEREGKTSTAAYKLLASQIDQVRLRVQELNASTDQLAKTTNQQLTDSLAKALDDVTKYGSSLKETVKSFLLEVATNVKKLFVTDIAERISQATGNTGKGGFGGFIQGALGGGQAGVVRGATAATPLYTQEVIPTGVPKSNEVDKLPTMLEEFANKIVTGFQEAWTAVKDFFGFASDAAETAKTATDAVDTASTVTSATGAVDSVSIAAAGAAFVTAADTAAVSIGTVASQLLAMDIALTPISPALGAVGTAAAAAVVAINAMSAAASASAVRSTVAHTGGIIGKGGLVSRNVHPMVFAGAPRYHSGGTAGLRPGEVPAILQQGEAVLTENQQSLVAAAMSPKGGGEMNLRNILVVDPNFIPDALASAEGERSLMSFVTKNRIQLRQNLGVN